jgi:cation diffusion facilitator family transporter
MMPDHSLNAEKEKRRASLVSLLAVLALIILKVAVALLTGSLAILAQAADSVLDLAATILAFFAVRVADRPPDSEHPYGHGKVENLAALAETVLLLVTCGWIIYEAIGRLFFRPVDIESSLWGIVVMVLSILVSLWLSTYLMRVAHKYRSQSLEGNALNFRTDVLSSSMVLLGLVLVSLSHLLGPQFAWLQRADAVAALIVALFVLRASLQLGWRAISELLDAAPPGLVDRITALASAVPGVRSVGPVRVRQSGSSVFVDMSVSVERSASLEEAHRVATEVETSIGTLVEEGDVVVHVDPVRHLGESLPQTVSAIAARFGLQTHNVHAHEVKGSYYVDLDVEVPPDLTLAQAHERVSELESAVRAELSYISELHTHIEPFVVPTVRTMGDDMDDEMQTRIVALVEGVTGLHTCHNLFVRPGPDGHDVVLHCQASPDLSVVEAHRLTDLAERQVRAEVPGIGQLLIHLEPGRHSDGGEVG